VPSGSEPNRLELKFEIVSERLYERVYEIVITLEFKDAEEYKTAEEALADILATSRSVPPGVTEANRPAAVLEFKIIAGTSQHHICLLTPRPSYLPVWFSTALP
jgi:hypothetical protein